MFDRARYGLYPPGSTFKLVTAMAALRLDPALENKSFSCRRLPDGRVGAIIPGWRKPIRDDVGDSAHGTLTMHRAITVSCNAYFAQLGVFSVGARQLSDTAKLLDIPAGSIRRYSGRDAVCVVWTRSGAGDAVQDGACGGDHRCEWRDAGGPLGDRREQRTHAAPKQILGAGVWRRFSRARCDRWCWKEPGGAR